MSNMKVSYSEALQAIGIDTWQLRCPATTLLLIDIAPRNAECRLLQAMLNTLSVPQSEIATLHLTEPSFQQKLNRLRPKILVGLGETVAQQLLNSSTKIDALRQAIHIDPASHTPLIITYHPNDLALNPTDKKLAWQDLQLISQALKTIT